MITHLNIQNFKSYQDISLSMGNLTILCGQNGMGKSTILQSLLLLRQSHLLGRLEEGLELNGDLCQIGSSQDALFYAPNSNNIKISLGLGEGKEANWSFKVGNGTDNFLFAEESEKNRALLDSCGIFSRKNFQYISSSRNPMEFYPKKDYEVIQNRQLSLSNGGGELVAHFLDYYKNDTVIETLRNKNARFSDLLSQTVAWEREISSNVNVNVGRLGEYYQITYSFNSNSGFKTPDFKSNNVGFGIGYTLPLIVAILSAKPGSVLLLENPEAHLHPYAQAKMAELMCLAAQAGIQIILETHSDHIINGTLVSIKKQLIDINEVKIYYIDREEEMLASRATEIGLIKGGKIKNQPKGFFDQMQMDLKILMGF